MSSKDESRYENFKGEKSHHHDKENDETTSVPMKNISTDSSKSKSNSNLSQHDHSKSKKPLKSSPTFLSSWLYLIKSSWINVLLVFFPAGIIIGALKLNGVVVFVINFIAIIPLAKLLGESTEQLALHTTQSIGGLLNATFGNAVEIIISIIALKDNLIRVVQSSLIGSILSNLLLVLGMSFFAGGIKTKTLKFNQTAAQTSSGILFIAVLGVVLPVALKVQVTDEAANNSTDNSFLNSPDENASLPLAARLLTLSRGASVIMLIIYGMFLFFQLYTHADLYADNQNAGEGEEEEEEEAQMTWPAALCALALVTVIVAVCSEYLVGSIDFLTTSWGISETFAGMILLPIVGNAAEHLTAVTVAMKNKIDLAIGVAVGSSQQIAMLVIPLMVILGWIIDRDMSLYFEVFETAALFMTVIVVYAVLSDGLSNWLEGGMLMGVYIIMAIAFYVV